MRRWVPLITSALLLTGCGAAAHGRGASASTMQHGGECTSSLYEGNVEVTIYGGFTAACEEWDRTASETGAFWQQVEVAGGEQSDEQLVCSMRRGAYLAEVRDQGTLESGGGGVCAALTAHGWVSATGPGAARERRRAEREAGERRAEERQEAAERARANREEEEFTARQEAREPCEEASSRGERC